MSVKKQTRSAPFGLFYIEMIIVLFFFMIASAVILRAFAAADNISKESDMLEHISLCSQTAAESFALSGDASEAVKAAFGADIGSENTAVIPIDESCTYSVDGDFEAIVSVREEELVPVMEISFWKSGGRELLYDIRFAGRSEGMADE